MNKYVLLHGKFYLLSERQHLAFNYMPLCNTEPAAVGDSKITDTTLITRPDFKFDRDLYLDEQDMFAAVFCRECVRLYRELFA